MSRENPCHYRYEGCAGAVSKGARCCESCRLIHNRRAAARRAELRKAGKCTVCGDPVAKSKKKIVAGVSRRVHEPATLCKKHLAYFAERAESRH